MFTRNIFIQINACFIASLRFIGLGLAEEKFRFGLLFSELFIRNIPNNLSGEMKLKKS
jgi:hypothetical protein